MIIHFPLINFIKEIKITTRSRKSYGLLIYVSTAKTSLRKIESVQRRILREIVFKTKLDPINDILLDNGILANFELYLSELLKEVLPQLGHEAPVQFLPDIKNVSLSTRHPLSTGIFSAKNVTSVLVGTHDLVSARWRFGNWRLGKWGFGKWSSE